VFGKNIQMVSWIGPRRVDRNKAILDKSLSRVDFSRDDMIAFREYRKNIIQAERYAGAQESRGNNSPSYDKRTEEIEGNIRDILNL
jgi:hypothetical protein